MATTQSKSHKSRKTASGGGDKPRFPALGSPPPTALAIQVPEPPSTLFKNSVFPDPMGDKIPPYEVPSENPKDQWWYREPTSKTRVKCAKIAVLDAAGHKDKVIAEKLGMTVASVRSARMIARRNGWWDLNDEAIDIEEELALNIDRKVVRNISASLDGKMTNWQTHEMTIAAAKGRGHFRNHDTPEGGLQQLPIVAIQVVMPAVGSNDQRMEIPDDMIGGTPSYIDGETS